MQADPQVDAPLIVASLSILLTLASSLALWIRHIQKSDSIIEKDTGTPAWPVGWVNFGIFVCAMIIFIYVAQIASGIFFSMIHWNLLSFLPLVLVGIFLARIYEKTGSILVAIWFHAFFNAFSLSMLFITNLSDVIPY